MKKYLFIVTFLFCSHYSFSQEMLNYIKSKIESHLSNSLRDRYKGAVEISDAQSYDGYYIVSGTFRYQIQTLVGSGNTVTRKFKSKVKVILDDVIVQRLCYVYIVYGYSDAPDKSCKCTDGYTISSDDILYSY